MPGHVGWEILPPGEHCSWAMCCPQGMRKWPSTLLPFIPAWGFSHLLCLAPVALILPCVSCSPSGSHVLQGDLIMSWWCHLVNAIRKFPQDFSCFAGSRAWLPGLPCCSSACSFSQKPSAGHTRAPGEGLAASPEWPLLPSSLLGERPLAWILFRTIENLHLFKKSTQQ